MNTDTDLLILGAGPTGLYAAYYARIRGLRTVVVDGRRPPRPARLRARHGRFGFGVPPGRAVAPDLVHQRGDGDLIGILVGGGRAAGAAGIGAPARRRGSGVGGRRKTLRTSSHPAGM
ncbi:hypothetical protein [Rhodococcus aetherivorans]|uniref:hypothetical protein n=1 Tax=Rhodococcus aetherivorans TaxID=191292 RepID=UPI001F49A179|nr:hypothetical protein [Rhodococcus aetherivorans]